MARLTAASYRQTYGDGIFSTPRQWEVCYAILGVMFSLIGGSILLEVVLQ
jgi:hypothetical protein